MMGITDVSTLPSLGKRSIFVVRPITPQKPPNQIQIGWLENRLKGNPNSDPLITVGIAKKTVATKNETIEAKKGETTNFLN
jgi:hypothetical protein